MSRGRLLVGLLLVTIVLVIASAAVAIWSLLHGDRPHLTAQHQILVLDLGGEIPDQPAAEEGFPGMGGAAVSMVEIDRALHVAIGDGDVERVLVRLGGLGIGFGKVQELRDALRRFSTESGKPVICWFEEAGNKEYLLATGCDEIYMAPEGFLLVNGLHLQATFWKGTLDKLGVQAEFTRAGRYKSAVETFTSTEMSEPAKEMMNSLADSLFDQMVQAIADGRELSPDQVRALIDDPPMSGPAALVAGLVDGLWYEDQLLTYLGGQTPASYVGPRATGLFAQAIMHDGAAADAPVAQQEVPAGTPTEPTPEPPTPDSVPTPPPAGELAAATPALPEDTPEPPPGVDTEDVEDRLVGVRKYLRGHRPSKRGDAIAVIFGSGEIHGGPSGHGGPFGGGESIGSDTLVAAIREARRDDRVKAIVLRIDSPGGSGLASDLIWRELELAQTEDGKPVVVSMSDLAASGGYYVSMGADAIVAEPGTITGSIGVFAGKFTLTGLFDKIGLGTQDIDRGRYAALFSSTRPLGEEGRAKLEGFVGSFYETFVGKAADGRRTTAEAIHAVAQGRVWTGVQATEHGPVDALAGHRTTITIAREKADMKGEPRLLLLPDRPSFLEELLGDAAGAAESRTQGVFTPLLHRWTATPKVGQPALEAEVRRLLQLAPLLASGTPLALLPYELDIQ